MHPATESELESPRATTTEACATRVCVPQWEKLILVVSFEESNSYLSICYYPEYYMPTIIFIDFFSLRKLLKILLKYSGTKGKF